jgi:diguanylate cyclase (GGDEF)-like protein/PAS domain S-box-containing protein
MSTCPDIDSAAMAGEPRGEGARSAATAGEPRGEGARSAAMAGEPHGEGARSAAMAGEPHGEGARSALEHARLSAERVFAMTDDLLAEISLDGRLTLLNPAWERVLGWSLQEMLGRSIQDLVHPEDVEHTLVLTLPGSNVPAHAVNFTSRYRHRDGSWRWLLWSARCDGHAWFAAAKDVTDRMSLERQALHDPLTKLPNRLLLMDRTRRALARLHRTGGLIALLFIDLDRFKAVNDNLGHAVGDDLLIAVSERLGEVLRDSDTVARLGGDEFVILAEDLESDSEALSLADRVLNALMEPTTIGSAEVSMQASVGISVCHEPTRDPEDLLREADVAMYRAKGGGGGLGLFDAELRKEMAARLEIETRLRHALPRHELRLVYQPTVPLQNDGAYGLGCEALLRWHPHDGHMMRPEEFLHLAEEGKLIVSISEWVLQTICIQAASWRREGLDPVVAMNISARGIAEVDIAERVREALLYSELPGEAICLEVSEAAILADVERAHAKLEECKSLGVKIALDRFGSEHGSLALAAKLPIDSIKLDRAIVKGLEYDRAKRGIVLAATSLAREANIAAVAVGIETERELELVRNLGCTVGQGFLLAEPQPPDLLRDELRALHSAEQHRTYAHLRRGA